LHLLRTHGFESRMCALKKRILRFTSKPTGPLFIVQTTTVESGLHSGTIDGLNATENSPLDQSGINQSDTQSATDIHPRLPDHRKAFHNIPDIQKIQDELQAALNKKKDQV
jgi:hypothetical protein